MDVKELRIGNYVGIEETALHANGCNHLEAIFEIEEIKKEVAQFKGFHAGEYYKDLKPIPLTEEWIKKFGFEFQEHESPHGMMLYTNDDWSFCLLEEFGTYSYAESQGEDYEYFDVMCLRTVHQLQNLHYALKGEELTLNEI